jgi:bacterioferritin
MQGDKKVIDQLNAALCGELTAIVQYMTQSEMCQNWGYERLAKITKGRAIEEMKHAEGLIERIMFLDGNPKVDLTLKPQIGSTVPEQFANGLKDESSAVAEYNAAAKICAAANDEGTKDLFEHMLVDEERHADFLESQLGAIKDIGLPNYLAQQLKG